MQTTISGIQVPDSVLAREVTELVRPQPKKRKKR